MRVHAARQALLDTSGPGLVRVDVCGLEELPRALLLCAQVRGGVGRGRAGRGGAGRGGAGRGRTGRDGAGRDGAGRGGGAGRRPLRLRWRAWYPAVWDTSKVGWTLKPPCIFVTGCGF